MATGERPAVARHPLSPTLKQGLAGPRAAEGGPDEAPRMRIDRWLWAVRLYKTLGVAARACKAKQVQVGGRPAKPTRTLRPGDVVTLVDSGGNVRKVTVAASLPSDRCGASAARQFYTEEEGAPLQPGDPQPGPPLARQRSAQERQRAAAAWAAEHKAREDAKALDAELRAVRAQIDALSAPGAPPADARGRLNWGQLGLSDRPCPHLGSANPQRFAAALRDQQRAGGPDLGEGAVLTPASWSCTACAYWSAPSRLPCGQLACACMLAA